MITPMLILSATLGISTTLAPSGEGTELNPSQGAGSSDAEPALDEEVASNAGVDADGTQEIGVSSLEEQREAAERLADWTSSNTIYKQESARACYEDLLEKRRGYLAKYPSVPRLRSSALSLPPLQGAGSFKEQRDTAERVLGELQSLTITNDSSDSTVEDATKALAVLERSFQTLANISVKAQLIAAQKAKKNAKELADLNAFDAAMQDWRRAVVDDWKALDGYLAGRILPAAPDLAKLEEAQNEQVEQLARTYGCREDDRLCLTYDGQLLGSPQGLDGLEPGFLGRLEEGSQVTVYVFEYVDADGKKDDASITLKMGEIERSSVLTRPAPEGEQGDSKPGPCKALMTKVGYQMVKSEVLTVPDKTTAAYAVVEFERSKQGDDTTVTVRARHRARIDHGLYRIDVGILVPFVPRGQQDIDVFSRGGSRFVDVRERLHVTGALALNVFPGGRRKDVISPFEDLGCDSRLPAQQWLRCRRRSVGRPIAELFGLQLAADFNSNLLDQIYVGVVMEPLTGLTFSTGVAILEVEDLATGVFEGQLVTSESDLVARQHHVARWYGGFTLSYDIVRFVQNARARFKDANK